MITSQSVRLTDTTNMQNYIQINKIINNFDLKVRRVGVSRMSLGREYHSRAVAFLQLHWPIVDLALILPISELSLKLRSCSSELHEKG